MSSAKNKRAVIVGVFIFVALAIFIVGILTLGGQHKTFVKIITVKAVFDDVSGLQTGNNVWFSGVKIGTVKKMGFSGKSQVEVILNIEEKAQQYIRSNAKAKISTDGLIGNKIIVIYGGTSQSPPIETGDVIGVEKALSTDDMMSTFQENNKNLLQITSDFKEVSKGIAGGKGTIGKLLKDETLVNNLQSTVANLRKVSVTTGQLTSSLSEYVSKLQTKGALANDLVTDTAIFSSLRSTVTELNQVASNANDLSNNLKNTSAGLSNKSTPIGMLLTDEDAAANLKSTLKNLNTSTQKLDENMEALQHNFLLRGFFRKKAKAAEKAQKDSTNQAKQ